MKGTNESFNCTKFEDGISRKTIGQEGYGSLPGSLLSEKEYTRQYQMRTIAHIPGLIERF